MNVLLNNSPKNIKSNSQHAMVKAVQKFSYPSRQLLTNSWIKFRHWIGHPTENRNIGTRSGRFISSLAFPFFQYSPSISVTFSLSLIMFLSAVYFAFHKRYPSCLLFPQIPQVS
jgi:hypothetical protein